MDTIEAKQKLVKPIREIFAEQLRCGQSVRMNIKGNCMRPFIKKSDIVTVKPIKFEQTRVGDIIVYSRSLEDDFTVHRLIRKRKDRQGREFLFTKGDVNIYGDGPVYPSDVYGKVVIIERKHGRIINLETKFNRVFAHFMVYFSWTSATLREAIFYPSKFLKRVQKYFLKIIFNNK